MKKEHSPEKIFKLFQDLHERKISPEKAIEKFKFLPYENLGFAKADIHRHFRTGLVV